jgi:hypothetical protein
LEPGNPKIARKGRGEGEEKSETLTQNQIGEKRMPPYVREMELRNQNLSKEDDYERENPNPETGRTSMIETLILRKQRESPTSAVHLLRESSRKRRRRRRRRSSFGRSERRRFRVFGGAQKPGDGRSKIGGAGDERNQRGNEPDDADEEEFVAMDGEASEKIAQNRWRRRLHTCTCTYMYMRVRVRVRTCTYNTCMELLHVAVYLCVYVQY